VTVLPATELHDWSGEGRRYVAGRTVRLGDVDPAGELRLDAIGRYLQDVASDDAVGAGLPNALGWVVRRTLLSIAEPAIAGEEVELGFNSSNELAWIVGISALSGACS